MFDVIKASAAQKCLGRSKAVTRTVSRWRTPKVPPLPSHLVVHSNQPARDARLGALLRAAGRVLMRINAEGEVKDPLSRSANHS
jgi:hypothetical protein